MALRDDLYSINDNISESIVYKKINLLNKIEKLEELQSFIDKKVDNLLMLGKDWKRFIDDKKKIPRKKFSMSDYDKIEKLRITYNYSIRNSIYMMLTRSFLTSYLILPDTAKNINLLEEGIGFVNRKGFLKVEEPSDDEKRNLANAIINRGNLHKSLFQKAEEIMDEMGVVDKEHRDMIHQLIRVRFKNKENDENKLRKFIQANSGALE